jgi:hypothetical protein
MGFNEKRKRVITGKKEENQLEKNNDEHFLKLKY